MKDKNLERLFARFARRGDVAALGEVFDRAAPELLVIAAHLMRDPEAAEDVVQAVFVAAIERAESFDSKRPLMAWLVGILTRQAKYRMRSSSRIVEPDRLDRRREVGPREATESAELAAAISGALDELPDSYREVLAAHLAGGKKPREIAREMGIAPGTVRVKIHRGLDLLRKALPPSFALGAAATVLPTRGLAAVRAEVVAAASAHAVAVPSSGAFSAALVSARSVAICAVLAAALGGSWFAWDRSDTEELAREDAVVPVTAHAVAELVDAGVDRAGDDAHASPQRATGRERPAARSEPSNAAVERTSETIDAAEAARWLVHGVVDGPDAVDGGETFVTIRSGEGERELLASGTADLNGEFVLDLTAALANEDGRPESLSIRADHPEFLPNDKVLAPISRHFRWGGRDMNARLAPIRLERPFAFLEGVIHSTERPVRVALFETQFRTQIPLPVPCDEVESGNRRYRLRVPRDGDYVVVATSETLVPVSHRIEVEEAGQQELDDLSLTRGRTVNGKVVLPRDGPATGIVVEAAPTSLGPASPFEPPSPAAFRGLPTPRWAGLTWNGEEFVRELHQVNTGAENAFTVRGLRIEPYEFRLTGVRGRGKFGPADPVRVSEMLEFVTLAAEVSILRVHLRSDDDPVVGAAVGVDLGLSVRGATTDERGYAELLVPAGQDGRVQVARTGLEPVDRGVRTASACGETTVPFVLHPTVGGQATLELFVDGAPAGSESVTLSWGQDTSSRRIVALAEGPLRFESLPVGQSCLRVRTDSRWSVPSEVEVDLELGSIVRREIVLESGGRIEVTLPRAAGKGVYVSVGKNRRGRWSDAEFKGPVHHCELPEPFLPGEYRVSVHWPASSSMSLRRTVEVRAGETTVLDLREGPDLDFDLESLPPEILEQLSEDPEALEQLMQALELARSGQDGR